MRNREIAHDNVFFFFFFFFFGSVGLRYKRSHFAFLISPTAPKQKVVYKEYYRKLPKGNSAHK